MAPGHRDLGSVAPIEHLWGKWYTKGDRRTIGGDPRTTGNESNRERGGQVDKAGSLHHVNCPPSPATRKMRAHSLQHIDGPVRGCVLQHIAVHAFKTSTTE